MSVKPPLAAVGKLGSVLRRLTRVPTKEAKFALGVDIGASAVKVVALGPRKAGGARPLLGHELVPIAGGPEANPADAVKAAVAALKVPTRTVALSVSGPWVIMRVVELPRMKADEMKQALPFEAQRYLPFNVEDVVIDGVALGPADESKDWVLIVACKKELIERRLDCARAAGLEVAVIDVDALALTNSFLAGRNGGKTEGIRALVDVGLQLSNLVVFKDQMPYLVRDIPWGAEKLARAVADQAGVEAAAVAEALAKGELSEAMRAALPAACEPLVTELQLSFDYFENRFGHAPAELLITGGLSQCTPFLEALKGHVAQSVTAWAPLQNLSGQFTVAYGLALRGSG
jgi:type IV pilus assembly protein PilM